MPGPNYRSEALLTTHTGALHSGELTRTVDDTVILDIGATDDIIGSGNL